MSFGFSVGDIVLLSQLAYKLYSNVTSGRRSADHDLKELEDVLFGLRCALDHLGRVASDISTTASNQDMLPSDVQEKLGLMISSCGSTLQELDSATQKYRDGVKSADKDAIDKDAPRKNLIQARGVARVAQLKRDLEINFTRVRWDMKRQSFQEYRNKLQSHVDAINTVLNTLLWSTAHRIETNSEVNSAYMKGLLSQSLQRNQSLLQLVGDIHNMLLDSKKHHLPQSMKAPGSPTQQSGEVYSYFRQNKEIAIEPGLLGVGAYTVNACYGTAIQMTTDNRPDSPNHISMLQDTTATASKPLQYSTSPSLGRSGKPAQRLPSEIVELNRQRQSIGSREFELRKHQLSPQVPVVKPSFLTLELPTIGQLRDGLTYIFRPYAQRIAPKQGPGLVERKNEIVRWIQGLDHFVMSCVSTSVSSPVNRKAEKGGQWNDAVDLLVHLNGSIEKSDKEIRELFYQASEHAQIESALNKLQIISKSVRVMKEFEEFEDVREEWKDGNSAA